MGRCRRQNQPRSTVARGVAVFLSLNIPDERRSLFFSLLHLSAILDYSDFSSLLATRVLFILGFITSFQIALCSILCFVFVVDFLF